MNTAHILVIDDESDRAEATAHVIETNFDSPDIDDRSWSSIPDVDEFIEQYRSDILTQYDQLIVATNITGIQNGFVTGLQDSFRTAGVIITTCWDEEETEAALIESGADPAQTQHIHCATHKDARGYIPHREKIESALQHIRD